MLKKIVIFFMLPFFHNANAELGCIDNSKHMDLASGYDYKTYYYVYCTCPCRRYAHSFHRGLCERCLHFRVPQDLEINE